MVLLGFIYWSTVAVIERQTLETIEAEIRGLAEQYREQGLSRLIAIVRERSDEKGNSDNVYLLVDSHHNRLAGNLVSWPKGHHAAGKWMRLTLQKRTNGVLVPHEVQAKTFILAGGSRLLVGRDMYGKAKFRATVIEALSWSLAATIGLGLAGGIFISRRMLRRLDRVSRTAQQIMEGDLSQRIDRSGSGDEFDRLSENLNAMLDQNDRLMTGMRLATDSIAHDLRSPLTRLKSRIELALRTPLEENQSKEALADVLAQTDDALALFDNLLRIATAESGLSQSELSPVDICALASDAAELYEPVADEKGIALEVRPSSSCNIRGHPDLLAQAFANLLDNAVKHTPRGGRITVTVEDLDDEIAVSVADTGSGVPEPDRNRILERFVRLEQCRNGPGAGLGLSLVAAVAKLHGASLQLGDNDPGFIVTLGFPYPSNSAKSSDTGTAAQFTRTSQN
jgi:signal transduction histidine kinase